MSDGIGQEKVAYVSPSETTWSVSIRDGMALSDGLFTVPRRNYYDTAEKAHDAAKRRVKSGSADRLELSVVAQRSLQTDE